MFVYIVVLWYCLWRLLLSLDNINVLDSVCGSAVGWEECFEDGSESFSEHTLEHFPACVSAIHSDIPVKSPISMQGRLWERSKFWKEELEASHFVLDIVTTG